MHVFLLTFLLCGLIINPVFAADDGAEKSEVEAPYFANVPHPGFSDPEGYDAVAESDAAAKAAAIEPAAGDEAKDNEDSAEAAEEEIQSDI